MGTRADFYVAHSETDLEWLGSIAWDGYEIDDVGNAESEQDFRLRLTKFLDARNDATYPKDGWPWPWRDSRLTDHAYVWVTGTGIVRRDGDDYPMDSRNNYQPDDGKCDSYVGLNREADLHEEASRLTGPHPLWDDDKGFREAAAVEVRYLYPDMQAQTKVRMDEGSGLMFLS